MFVVASWISFVVKPEVVPGRMALLVTILLVQLNLFNNAKDKAPVSTNLNAVDLYLIFSMLGVFSALMEYAIILTLKNIKPVWTLKLFNETRSTQRSNIILVTNRILEASNRNEIDHTCNSGNNFCPPKIQGPGGSINKSATDLLDNENMNQLKDATDYVCGRLDVISLCLAPFIFVVFHIAYCMKYRIWF